MAASNAPQSQQGNPVVESRGLVASAALFNVGERGAKVFRPTAILRELVLQAADVYGFVVEPIDGGKLVGLPDRYDVDWFVLADCGHVSTLYVHRARALAWRCPVCDEARALDAHATIILNRLQHLRSLSASLQSGNDNLLRQRKG